MSLLTRLNLRHNWPLMLSGIVLIASLSIFQYMPYRFSKVIPFDIKEIVDYPNLLFKFGGFPITKILILVPFAFLSLFGTCLSVRYPKVLTAIMLLVASASVCVGFTKNEAFVSGDKTRLSHIQTFHYGYTTYQLTRVRNVDDSGLISDSFWVFKCASDEIHCLYVEHNGRQFNPVIGGDTPEPSAELNFDPSHKWFYLQIDDEKTYLTP